MNRTLFLKSFLFIFFCMSGLYIQAAYFKNIAIRITQPNGVQLTVFATGDEYYNWIHDAHNYTIVQNPATGYYVYAKLVDDELVPTKYVVGISNPAATGLSPGLNIPGWKMEQIRQQLLDATPHKPSIVPPSAPLMPDLSGNVNNIVIFIRFSDQDEFGEDLTYYDDMFNNNTTDANSMFNYFKDVSYNAMFVSSSFYPLPNGSIIISYQDTHPRNYYVPFDSVTNPIGYHPNEETSREHTLLKNAVLAIASQVPADLNIDFDNDGYVDNVCFIIKGTTTAWSTLLWPHRWSLFSQTCYINGKQVWDYNLQLETFLAGSGVGVLAHEMSHTFGCPDLYHYNGDGFSPVGPWDLMDGNTNPPQHIGAYMKKKYTGWISDIPSITSAGTYTLNPLHSATNNAYKLVSPNSSTEFFIFEYRKKEGTFEGALPASGLLIYRINTLAGNGNAGGPPDEIYLYRPGGTDSTNGSVYSGYFSLASGRTEFNDYTNPKDFLSNGTTMGGINISNVTATDATISFTVNMNTMADFSADITSTCINNTVSFTDQSFGGPTSWSWSITPNSYYFVNGTSSNSQNPQVQFNTSGYYTVTLIASGPNGSSTKTKTDYINILSSSAPPLTETFESGFFTTNNWTINNPDGLITWDLYTGAGGNGGSTKSAYMDFYNYSSYPVSDDLIAKPISLSNSGNASLTFKVAYRQYDATYHDSLKVMISTDCGSNFAYTPYSKGDATLATGDPTTSMFVPSVEADWRTDTINLTPFLGQTITVKFRAVNGYGNNLYIDDINLSGITPVVANFSGIPTTLCPGGTVQFSDLSSGSPTSWVWNFGDGNFSTLQNPSHQYNSTGQFSVALTVSKPGSSHSITKTNYITVNPSQTVTASITQNPPGAVCINSPVTFNASVVNGGDNPTYQWKKNNANVGTNSSFYTVSNLSNGDIIKCVVTSTIACPVNNPVTSNEIQVSVLQNVVPSVSITASPSNIICQGTTVTFTATPVNGGSNPVYQWKKNGTNVGTNSPVYTDDALNGGDQVICSMTSSNTCVINNPVNSNLIQITVNPVIAAGVSISANPPGTVCSGSSVTFTASPLNGGSSPVYQWKKNGNNVGTNSIVYTTNSLQQGDIIICQMTSSASCAENNPAISNAILMNVANPAVVGVTISVSPSNIICQGQAVTFTSLVTNGGSNPQYQWKRNGILAGTDSIYTSSSISNGENITCQVTSNASCVTGNPAVSNVITMTVNPQLPVSVTISQSPTGPVCAGTLVTFNANISNGGDNPAYQWKKNNVVVDTVPLFSSATLSNGDVIKCTVTSSASCVISNPANSNQIILNVLPSYPVSVSIDASPAGPVCEGTSVTYTATPVNGGTTPTYEWLINGTSAGTGNTFTSSTLPDGTLVDCILTSSISSCALGNPASSNTILTDIHPLPVVNLGNDTIISSSSTLTLDAGPGYSNYLWSTGETTQTIIVSTTGEYAVTVTDNTGCTGSDAINVTVGFSVLQGYVNYLNTASTPMNNSTVDLKEGTTIIASTTTDGQGHYYFEGLAPGTYKIIPSSAKPWGGVNSTDALLVMKHFVGMTYLSGLKLKAANVDAFPAVNAVDAFLIQKRTVGLITSFPVGDWVFDNPTITVTGIAPINQNLFSLTTGDVNGSFTPAAKEVNAVELRESALTISPLDQKLDIPLICVSALEAGAVTLFINYPWKDLVLNNITMGQDRNDNLVYSEKDGIIAISWADLNAMSLTPGEALLTLHFTVIKNVPEGYILSSFQGGEIANAVGVPYVLVTLNQPYITSQASGISAGMNVFPNPFQGSTNIFIDLPNDGNVNMTVYNSQGQKMKTLVDKYLTAGKKEIIWDGKNEQGMKLQSGAYYIRMIASGQSRVVPVILLP